MCVIQLLLSVAAFAQTQVTGHVADVRGDDTVSYTHLRAHET